MTTDSGESCTTGKSTFGRGTLKKKSYRILIRTIIFLFQKIAAKCAAVKRKGYAKFQFQFQFDLK
jgi:hypothetical protein